MVYFSPDAEIERMRRESIRDSAQRIVILGDGLGRDPDVNLYAGKQRLWVRDIGSRSEGGYNIGGLPYRMVGGIGYTPEIDKIVIANWEEAIGTYRIAFSDPDHMEQTGRSILLENANDPHNQFHRTEQLLPLRAQWIGGLKISVQSWQYKDSTGQYQDYGGSSAISGADSEHIDATSLIPVADDLHAYVLVAFNCTSQEAGTEPLETFASTPKDWFTPLDKTDIQECLDQMGTNSVEVAAFRIASGDTDNRGHVDDRDLRPWVNVPAGNAMSDWRFTGDTGTTETVTNNQLVNLLGGDGIDTTTSNPDTLTIAVDASVARVNGPLGVNDILAQLGEAMTVGQSYFLFKKVSDGKWYKADRDASSPILMSHIRGVLLDAGTGVINTYGVVRLYGLVSGFSGLTPGADVYLDSTAGAWTHTEPSPTLDGVAVMIARYGYAVSTTQIMVDSDEVMYRHYVTIAASATDTITHHDNIPSASRRLETRMMIYDPTLIETYAGSVDTADELRGRAFAGSTTIIDNAGVSTFALGDSAGTDYRVAQSFQVTGAGRLSQFVVRFAATTGTPSAAPYWAIYPDVAGNPGGAQIIGATMPAITPSADNTITISNGPILLTSTTYWLVLEIRTMQATNNFYSVTRNTGNPYASGVMKADSTTGASFPDTWVALPAGSDMRLSVTTAATVTNDLIAQGVSHTSTSVITSIRLWLRKVGTPTGTLTASLYSDNSGSPNTVITNGNSSGVSAASLTTSYAYIEFVFPVGSRPTITASTQYFIVLSTTDAQSNTNYIELGADNTSPSYANGQVRLSQSGSWLNPLSVQDAIFDLYAQGTEHEEVLTTGIWGAPNSTLQIAKRIGSTSGTNKATQTSFRNVSQGAIVAIFDVIAR